MYDPCGTKNQRYGGKIGERRARVNALFNARFAAEQVFTLDEKFGNLEGLYRGSLASFFLKRALTSFLMSALGSFLSRGKRTVAPEVS